MREITWSVKVALKCLIAVVLVDVGIPYWTSKVEHIVASAAIFSNICTAHAQKRLFMNFRCKYRHRRSIPQLRLPVRVQNFRDLATFAVDFCILYACPPFECPPYFYFRFVWPTDLESIPHTSTPTLIIPTKFEVDMTIHYRVIAFCLLIRHVTSSHWPSTVWPRTVEVHGGYVPSLATKFEDPTHIRSWVTSYNASPWLPLKMRTRPQRMRRITRPASRWSKNNYIFWNPRPRFAYPLYNFGGSTMKVIGVICENIARPCVKRRMSFRACAKSRDLLKVPVR